MDTLPVEIHALIFTHLDSESLAHSACVSKAWNAAAHNNLLWQHLCQRDFVLIGDDDPTTAPTSASAVWRERYKALAQTPLVWDPALTDPALVITSAPVATITRSGDSGYFPKAVCPCPLGRRRKQTLHINMLRYGELVLANAPSPQSLYRRLGQIKSNMRDLSKYSTDIPAFTATDPSELQQQQQQLQSVNNTNNSGNTGNNNNDNNTNVPWFVYGSVFALAIGSGQVYQVFVSALDFNNNHYKQHMRSALASIADTNNNDDGDSPS
eukprot:TRINITY_DN3341_c0_g1_i7.p1 TRINITY_DN3341_c0_g1~~TRINITY_DN3341_c0_g1_i7.p1  ORF type:complete len:277 (+),score=69.37 TRINITY_DN3341_c0_g1_i7:30-833(+)